MRRQFEPWDAGVAAPTAGALVAVAAVVTAVVALASPPDGGALGSGLAVGVPVALLVLCSLLFSPRARRASPLLTLVPLGGVLVIAGLDIATEDASVSGHIFFCYPVLYAASQLRTGAAALVTAVAVVMDAVVAFSLSPVDQAVTDVAYMTTTMVALAVILVRKGRLQDSIIGALRTGQAEMTRQATHDSLTGLPNRALFHERLRHALSTRSRVPPAGRRDGSRRQALAVPGVAVLFCDLDGFKAVNDTLGHRAGDELLVEVARRLQACLRRDDLIARLGGDEFAVLLHACDLEGASAVSDRLLAAASEPFALGDRLVRVGISIGITLADQLSGTDMDRLVREADVAMYEAKAAGRGRAVTFSPAMLATQLEHASLLQDLRGAVRRGEISVEYQPVLNLTTDRVDGVEALARWTHPGRGLVPPDVFTPLAEQSGLIGEIGGHVLTQARADAEAFAAAAGRPVSIGVNVSARQLGDTTLLGLIASGRTDRTQLILEVTESTLVRPEVIPLVAELRRRDVRIAMDDFGIGQSSISALRLLPVDIIKLDRSFTVDIASDPRARAIVRAVGRMAGELDVALVAEGIETVEQREALVAAGCDYGQGYQLARPMSARALQALLQQSSGRSTAGRPQAGPDRLPRPRHSPDERPSVSRRA